MARIKLGPVSVKGIDVSNHQPNVDFRQVRAAGYEFVILKASEALTFKDKSFQKHRANAKAAGLVIGAYHFFHSDKDGVQQAENLFQAVNPWEKENLPLVLDLEWNQGIFKKMDEATAQNALKFLAEIERLTGEVPFIYTANGFFGNCPKPERFAKYPLWIANYGVSAPSVPAPWKTFAIWQYSDTTSVPGAGSRIDVNYFNGSLEQLRSMASDGRELPAGQITFNKGAVEALQISINAMGYTPRLDEDDIPGTKTQAAVEALLTKIKERNA